MVGLLERALDDLEVLEVAVADRFLGGLAVAGLQLLQALVERRAGLVDCASIPPAAELALRLGGLRPGSRRRRRNAASADMLTGSSATAIAPGQLDRSLSIPSASNQATLARGAQ